MADFIRTEQNGIEYFTVVATGESAVSLRGLAILSGVPLNTVSRWFLDLSHEGHPKWLKPLQAIPLDLSHGEPILKNGKVIKPIAAKTAAKFVSLVARNLKTDKALESLDLFAEIGLNSYVC